MKPRAFRLLWLGVLLAAPLGQATEMPLQGSISLYEQGVAARKEQRFEDAIVFLRQAQTAEPKNADIFVQLGFTLLSLDQLDESEIAFSKALQLAPAYRDANLGLAQIAMREKRLADAEREINLVLKERPDSKDALKIRSAIHAARDMAHSETKKNKNAPRQPQKKTARLRPPIPQRKPDPVADNLETGAILPEPLKQSDPRWRFDISTEISALTKNRPAWYDTRAIISYSAAPDLSYGISVRHLKRGGLQDLQLGGFFYWTLSGPFWLEGMAAFTPSADMLPAFSTGLSAFYTGPGDVTFGLEGRADFYEGDDVFMLAPSVRLPVHNKLDLTLKYTHAVSTVGVHSQSVVGRIDFRPHEMVTLFLGAARGNEIDGRTLVGVNSAFAGLRWNMREHLVLTASYAKEFRTAFDRQTVGLSLGVRF